MWYRFLLPVAACATFSMTLFGQGPVGDEVMVTFDRAVQVGTHTLPAGEYTIRQVTSASNPRVLEFTTDNGTKLEATVTAIPILQNTPPSKTKVILDNEFGTPRLDKIWVQGKSYGYQFPGKANAVSASTGITLEGRYVAPVAVVAIESAPPPAPREETVIAQVRPEPPAPVAQAPEPEPARTPPPAETSPEPTPPAHDMPATALGWMPITLVGLLMFSVGLVLFGRERIRS